MKIVSGKQVLCLLSCKKIWKFQCAVLSSSMSQVVRETSRSLWFQHRLIPCYQDNLAKLVAAFSSSSHRSPIRQQEDFEEPEQHYPDLGQSLDDNQDTRKSTTECMQEPRNSRTSRSIGKEVCESDKVSNLKKKESIKEFSEIPGPSPSLPLIGTNWIYFKFGETTLLVWAQQDKHAKLLVRAQYRS